VADVFDCRSGLDGGGHVADAFDEKEAAGVTLFSLAQGAGLFDFGVGATGDDIHAAHYTVRPGCAQVGTDYTYKRRAGRSTNGKTNEKFPDQCPVRVFIRKASPLSGFI